MFHQAISHLYYRSKPVWKLYRSLNNTQYLPRGELIELQHQKLKRVVECAQVNSPFWQARFAENEVSSATLKSLDDLQMFPILEKNHIQTMALDNAAGTHGLVVKRTGGTTGEPVTIYSSKNHVYWSMAAMLRFYDWVGYKVGNRRAKLFAAPTRTGIPEHTLTNRLRNWLGNTLYLDALDLTSEKVEQIITLLDSFRPQVLLGYTSCLAVMARTLGENGRRLSLPDLKIINAAEPLDPQRREIIEVNLGDELFNHYGTRDVGYIADECELRQGLHVHMEYLAVEIVDENGYWVKDGEEGDILITELENFGMPIIRYRIGDRAVRTRKTCPCGRGLQVIPAVTGRSTDIILLPNGNKLTGLVFPHALKDFPIAEYQIVQKQLDIVEAKVVLEPGATESTLQAVQVAMKNIMPGVTVNLTSVTHIPRTRSGKLRSVISELNKPDTI
jgi:phenylacetate-CoA ligase